MSVSVCEYVRQTDKTWKITFNNCIRHKISLLCFKKLTFYKMRKRVSASSMNASYNKQNIISEEFLCHRTITIT